MKTPDKVFVDLISKHQKIIHKVCNVYCHTLEDRQDLFQEIVLQLWRAYPNFKGEAKFTTWLYRVALNTAITQKRKQQKSMVGPGQTLGDLQITDSSQEQIENQQLLQMLINSLNDVEKSIIFLYLEEKSYEEIAHIMGMSKSNVSVKLVRIKKKLEKRFKQENNTSHRDKTK